MAHGATKAFDVVKTLADLYDAASCDPYTPQPWDEYIDAVVDEELTHPWDGIAMILVALNEDYPRGSNVGRGPMGKTTVPFDMPDGGEGDD